MTETPISARCCIVGGGPAGMMLGFLLARAGVDVLVIEKHADFLRDFRGDTIHPSTLELMHELGILDELLRLPHQKASILLGQVGGTVLRIADFRHLPTACRFIAFMPQWEFLNFLADRARRYPTFRLLMQAEATGLIETEGRFTGVRATTSEGQIEIRADLVVGADGRHSIVRGKAGLEVETLGAPMDVLWFSLPRGPADPDESTGSFDPGRIFIRINRGAHWQCGYVIPKGSAAQVRERGLHAFHQGVGEAVPFARDRLEAIRNWDDVKLLTVAVDRLLEWARPGLLCIGDSAHAMSPVGGVGINLAIQDAVATANLLAAKLRTGRPSLADLGRVQKRRAFPTRVTQGFQVLVQRRVISRILGAGAVSPPLILRVVDRFPLLQRIPARLLGIGVRPEHVRTPEI